jgi:hypothetical protein
LELTDPQRTPDKSINVSGDFAVDLLVIEFLGLALVAMCVLVVALPCARKSSQRVRYE